MSQHIIGLQAANVKRLTAVNIKLDPKTGKMVIISGKNGHGKTSTLDCITMALCGGKTIPEKPIRDGKKSATIVLETEEITVTRTFKEGGETELSVKTKDGFKASKPQNLLSSLYSAVAFDPNSFSKMELAEQTKLLLQIFPTKIDLVENSSVRKGAYETRTDHGREVKRLQALIDTLPTPPAGTPTLEVSVAALAGELNTLQKEVDVIRNKKSSIEALRANCQASIARSASLTNELERINASIAKEAKSLKEFEEKLKNLEAEEFEDPLPKIEAVKAKIQSAENDNMLIRTGVTIQQTKASLAKEEAEVARCTKKIEDLDNARAEALKSAKFPVEGLSINDIGAVTFNNVPFSQASEAQKIRIGLAIGAAANPKLRVCIIRDGSLLDEDSMKMIAEMAEKLDLQVWVERVQDASAQAIQIVEGSNIGATDAPDSEDEQPTGERGGEKETIDATPIGAGGLFGPSSGSSKKKTKKDKENTDPFRA